MTRKLRWYLLLCLAELTILPGCQYLPYFGCADVTARNRESPTETIVQQNQVTAQMPDRPYPQAVSPGPIVETRPKEPEKKKPDAGTSSIVTIEPSSDPPPQKLPPIPIPQTSLEAVGKGRAYADLVQALQDMIDGRPEDAVKRLGKYDDATQEVLLRILPPLTNLANKGLGDMSPQEVTVFIDGLHNLLQSMIPRSELTITKTHFCKWVKGFGKFESLPENHAFLTGTVDRLGEEVQLYVELKNFENKQTKNGDYLTKLACTLELHDSTNTKVWGRSVERKQTTHCSRSPMNDFYSNYSFYVPEIPAGTYKLTIRLTDETNPDAKLRRTASESLVFRVTPAVSQPPLR